MFLYGFHVLKTWAETAPESLWHIETIKYERRILCLQNPRSSSSYSKAACNYFFWKSDQVTEFIAFWDHLQITSPKLSWLIFGSSLNLSHSAVLGLRGFRLKHQFLALKLSRNPWYTYGSERCFLTSAMAKSLHWAIKIWSSFNCST